MIAFPNRPAPPFPEDDPQIEQRLRRVEDQVCRITGLLLSANDTASRQTDQITDLQRRVDELVQIAQAHHRHLEAATTSRQRLQEQIDQLLALCRNQQAEILHLHQAMQGLLELFRAAGEK